MENQTKLNGSELLLECLKKEKVELINELLKLEKEMI